MIDGVVVVVVVVGDNGAAVVVVVVGGGGGDGDGVELSNRGVFGCIGCTDLSLQHKPYSSLE